MKNKHFYLVATLVALFILSGCSKESFIDFPADEMVANSDSLQLKAASVGSISAITSDKGFGTYASYFKSDIEGISIFTISGKGFGSKAGQVKLSGVSSYSVSKISSWSDSKVVCHIKSNTNSEPTNKSSIVVYPSAGGNAAKTFSIVPYIAGKQWGQCTWYANKRRIENGLSYQAAGKTYSNYSGSVDANYMPKKYDILIWHNEHEAFIEAVTTSTAKNSDGSVTYTYNLSISEYNIQPEKYSTYSTIVKVKDYKGKRTIISGTYRSGRKTSATNYFR
jgi:hypothetical protein